MWSCPGLLGNGDRIGHKCQILSLPPLTWRLPWACSLPDLPQCETPPSHSSHTPQNPTPTKLGQCEFTHAPAFLLSRWHEAYYTFVTLVHWLMPTPGLQPKNNKCISEILCCCCWVGFIVIYILNKVLKLENQLKMAPCGRHQLLKAVKQTDRWKSYKMAFISL